MSISTDRQLVPGSLELFTVAECAVILGVSRKLISNWIHTNVLPAIRLGPGQRLIRVRRVDLENFITAQQQSPAPTTPTEA